MLNINDLAPLKINALDENGDTTSLSNILGKPSVIYFYPKDNTPGCTKEACSFRDFNTELQKLGVQIIGVSADSPDSHSKFKSKHSLNFPLWSDPDRKLITAFGAIGKKSMFGKVFLGIKRISFALDKNGRVIMVWPKVNAETHAKEVLDFFTNFPHLK
ncbi:MAG: peroxiredoxin [Pseudomonadales bacterium]|nr:peroxiredoxin [Pseudomonadales bacterium]